jgi:hypothetical protein
MRTKLKYLKENQSFPKDFWNYNVNSVYGKALVYRDSKKEF